MKIKSELFYKVIGTLVSFVLSIILGIILPRAIGPESYGEYNYIISTFNFILQLVLLSINTAFMYLYQQEKFKKDDLISCYSFFLISVIFLTSVLGILTVNIDFMYDFLWLEISNVKLIYLGSGVAALLFLQLRVSEYCDMLEEAKLSEKIKNVTKFFIVIFVFLFLFNGNLRLDYVFVIYAISTTVYLIVISIKLKIYSKFDVRKLFAKSNFEIIRSTYEYIKPLILFNLIGSVYLYVGRFAVQKTSGLEELGLYMAALNLANIPIQFISALIAIYMRKLVVSNNRDRSFIKRFYNQDLVRVFSLHCMFSFFVFFNAENIVNIVFGEKYQGAGYTLQVLAIFSLIHTYGILGGNVYMSTNRNKEYAFINGAFLLIGIVIFSFILAFYKVDAFTFAIITTTVFFLRVFIQTIRNLRFLDINVVSYSFNLIK
ncbi:oligosaccharide flippase family protein, partial [Vibrio parahaemolyticus]|nr:oligosaccharide flippase family protein [Vibrio parahaemolyticus]